MMVTRVLLLLRGSHDGLSHGCGVILHPIRGGGGGLLLIDGAVGGAAWHGRQDSGGVWH
jgi:hypothetical protein